MCKYCDTLHEHGESTFTFTGNDFGNYPVSCGIIKPKEDDDVFNIKAGTYYLEVDGEDTVFAKINYCPVCGRKLS